MIQDITTQLNGAEERAKECLHVGDFAAIAGGISNIAALKEFDPLKAVSTSALTEILNALEAHAVALKKEFSERFEQKNFVQLELLIGQASAPHLPVDNREANEFPSGCDGEGLPEGDRGAGSQAPYCQHPPSAPKRTSLSWGLVWLRCRWIA